MGKNLGFHFGKLEDFKIALAILKTGNPSQSHGTTHSLLGELG